MRVPFHIVQARREKLAELIERHHYLPLRELCKQLGISEATARRDLNALAKCNKLKRTHGGALVEFNDRFLSFNERRASGNRGKLRMAKAALRLIQPGGVYFFDSGTTIFALAEAFRENPVTPVSIVTSNIPVGELLSSLPEIKVFQLAGQVIDSQSVLLGETACQSLEFWNFDVTFLSAEAANQEGIFSSNEVILKQQLVSIRRSSAAVFCLDARKIGAEASILLRTWPEIDYLLTDASSSQLSHAGIGPEMVKIISCDLHAPVPDFLESEREQIPVHFL